MTPYHIDFGKTPDGQWVWRCSCEYCRQRLPHGPFATEEEAEADVKVHLMMSAGEDAGTRQ